MGRVQGDSPYHLHSADQPRSRWPRGLKGLFRPGVVAFLRLRRYGGSGSPRTPPDLGPDASRLGLRRIVGSGCPPPNPTWSLILGGLAKLASGGPCGTPSEKWPILTPCGAKSRGGGGAPPTTLILLRNQRPRVARPRHPRQRRFRGPPGPRSACQIRQIPQICQILPFLLFCSSC